MCKRGKFEDTAHVPNGSQREEELDAIYEGFRDMLRSNDNEKWKSATASKKDPETLKPRVSGQCS